MGKYHKIIIDKEYTVRDLSISPFTKKFRVAPLSLKRKILEKIQKEEDIEWLKYINSRIHFFIVDEYLHIEDEKLSEYISKYLHDVKNDINI